jgi:hypothetical protein
VATSQEEAVSELREAVLATRASNEWFNDDRQVPDLVQHSVARWVDDLGRSLRRADTATAKARQHSGEPDEEMAEELEEAITQIGSARDKLVAVAALVFGVPSLVPQKPGIKFEPRDSAVKNTLSELGAAGHAQAGQVKSRLDRLDDHPAITLRNQILHALSPLGNVAENCWIRRADLDEKGGIRVGGWSRGPLYPKHTLDQGDIKPETIWNWAVTSSEEAIALLIEATDALAKLVQAVGEIKPPQAIYRWPDGKVQFERPKSDFWERGLATDDS